MKFIFNDSLSIDSNLFKTEDKMESVIITSGLILEKNLKLATVTKADFDDMIDRYNIGDPKDKSDIMTNEFNLLDDDQKKDFLSRISRGKDKSGNFAEPSGDSLIEKAVTKTMDVSELTGEASEKASAKLSNRNRIISLLRSQMTDEQIGQLFDNIFSKDINESELIEIINDALLYSVQASTNLPTILNFMINHYDKQRDLNLTREITKLAAEVREGNPDVNIFEMLAKSAVGKIPDVAMVNLIDDNKMRGTVLSLIGLTQMRVVEQNEAVRRELQKVRDGLQSMQERTNLQRALVDALKMIEVDTTLTKEIEEFGKLFKKYMSDPYFRALRNILYDLSAARKLVDVWGTLVTDTQPITPRQTDVELRGKPQGASDTTQQGKIDTRGIGRMSLQNDSNSKFIKIAQNKSFFSNESQQQAYNQIMNSLYVSISKLLNTAQQYNSKYAVAYFSILLKNISKANNDPSFSSKLFDVTQKDFENYLKSNVVNEKLAQVQQQTTQTPVAIDPSASEFTAKLKGAGLDAIRNLGWAESVQGNIQAATEATIVFNTIAQNVVAEQQLQKGIGGLLAPAQLRPGLTRAFIANNEIETDNMVGLTREESNVRTNLAKKRNQFKETLKTKKEILDNAVKMQVDLGEGSDGQTPLETPTKIKELYEDLANWLKQVITQVQYEKDLLKRGFDRKLLEKDPARKLDPFALKTVEAKLAEIENDLKYFQNEYGRISSTRLISEQMARKQRLLQKLGPIQKEIAKLKKAGFSSSGLMFNFSAKDAGGQTQTYGNMLYSILNEEKKALGILLNAYQEARKSTTPVDLSAYLGPINSTSSGEIKLT